MNNYNDMYEYFEINLIELLGCTKNNIVEAKEKVKDLPEKYKEKLSHAYDLIDEVQEFLYNN